MTDLLSLLGSRICHDLVNPLGAIGNGVELLQMTGARGPELELVEGAVAAAQARLRFFRIAFGAAAPDQNVAEAELRAILADMTRDSRLRVDWQAGGDIPRPEARLAFLAILCAESALPRGGTLTVRRDPGWSLRARDARVAADPDLWACLTGAEPPETLAGGTVHYALMPLAAAEAGRRIVAEAGEEALWIAF
ncbi:MAG: histidine phosphotransferase ChpT [Rhodobacteraceae bacterium HLUCCA08]|nr:MAG: histidine phosphotransferase ChpT [Rhodobacteraceae bacterium HLUCCA08]